MFKLYLIVTNDGYIKFSHYFIYIPLENRPSIEAKVTDLCLQHKDDMCHFFEDEDSVIIFRNFGQCITIVVADSQENELVAYEFLGLAFTLFQNYFGKFMEKNILNNVDKLHMILEEVVVNGEIVETSSKNVLGPLLMFDSLNAK